MAYHQNLNQNINQMNQQVPHNVNAFDLGAILPEYIVQGIFLYNNLEHRVYYDARVNARIPIAIMVYVNHFINPFMYFNENFLIQNQATFGPHMFPRALNWYNYVGQNPHETTAGINAINNARLGYVYMLNDMINVATIRHNQTINNNIINHNNHIINQNNLINQNIINQNIDQNIDQNIIDQNNLNAQNIIDIYNDIVNHNMNNHNIINPNIINPNIINPNINNDNVIEH